MTQNHSEKNRWQYRFDNFKRAYLCIRYKFPGK